MKKTVLVRSGLLSACALAMAATAQIPDTAAHEAAPGNDGVTLRLRFAPGRTDVYAVKSHLVGGVPTAESLNAEQPVYRFPHDDFALEAVEALRCLQADESGKARVSYGWQHFELRDTKAGQLALQCKVSGLDDLRKVAGEPSVLRFAGFVEAPILYTVDRRAAVTDVALPRPLMGFDADRIIAGYRDDIRALHALVLPEHPVRVGDTWSAERDHYQGCWAPAQTIPSLRCHVEARYDRDAVRDGIPCAVIRQTGTLREPVRVGHDRVAAHATIETLKTTSEFFFDATAGRLVAQQTSTRMVMLIERGEGEKKFSTRLLADHELCRVLQPAAPAVAEAVR